MAEHELDAVLSVAAATSGCSLALLSFMDEEREWFKAKIGFDLSELSLDNSFCAHMVSGSEPLIVSDTAADPRFCKNSLVLNPPGIRFYAGFPITADGHAVGALAVLDRQSRQLSAQQISQMEVLSRLISDRLQLRRTEDLLAASRAVNREQEARLRENQEVETRLIEWSPDCIAVLDLDGRVGTMNLGGMQALEICDTEELSSSSWTDFWKGRDVSLALEAIESARRGGVGRFTGFRATQSGIPKWWDVMVSPIRDPTGSPTQLVAVMRDISERRRAVQMLRVVSEGTAAVTGGDFFRSLVQHLAGALDARYSFVAECTDPTKTKVRTLAYWQGGDFGADVTFLLRGTPCEKVIGGEVCCYPERLQSLFPEEAALVRLNAQSYLGVPIHAASGDILGHLVVLDDKPMGDMEYAVPILRIFAARAGSELERSRTEASLKNSEARRRMLLEINNAIVTKLTRDELWSAIAEAMSRVVAFDRIALALYDPQENSLRIVSYAGSYTRDDYTPLGRRLKLDDSPAGLAFVARKPVLRRDLELERLTSSEERAYGHGFRSICALPLVVRRLSIGAITLGSLNRSQYSESDADFLMQVANQIAIAVDNLRAHEETEALKARFQAEAVYLQEEIKTEHNFEEIIGQSTAIRALLKKLEQVAPTDATVLIHGETGTGKELLARAVHDRSRRKTRPLVKVNCGSIPSGLVESELFGHERGAFTGATQQRIGRFELAHGGTIFLDEVTELPLETQVKLLRVLQEGEFERVGSSRTIKVDVRVIAATNRNLQEVVRSGIFRSDLFYRLNVFPLDVPALNERREDIPLLVNFFLGKFSKSVGKEIRGLSQKSMERLVQYGWPGNIRELQNVVERAVVLAKGAIVQIDDPMLGAEASPEEANIETLENVERNHI
ncbi:MAG TPA: sigma 54-interacting transcriptional regulator, partial [Candidatus Binatia bacterium]|nr:sigma 54-interacting transcriptional regulator [Candidatus Binatia bacterium]